ncbi:hypothetical protein [Aureimonas jatrophae]|uniref:Uncharacterized protein n=1 Tax=Aureimonas jatrophae TaxID=1166073 RepID=A0A1H0EM96_9HYPH|nr:hypothetical protein [Aureimonas jatrophae]MBB3950429.1 type IV secretory pathway TrbL component [Aureimonas jatrophae]SDN83455.1 hypothetical protein SAMN05192530_102107 [Aureimonas jatrophae]
MRFSVPALSLVALFAAGPVLADGLVPGSDHFTEMRADAAANSVAFGTHVPVVTSSVSETRSYGSGTETYAREPSAREPSRIFETRPGGPAERVAATRPWVRGLTVSNPG